MTNLLNKKSLIYLIIIFIAFLLAIGLIWYFSQIPKPKEIFPIEIQPKAKILTPEEIAKALSKKAEPSSEIKPLNEKETSRALEKKSPQEQQRRSLNLEEIQKALNKKE